MCLARGSIVMLNRSGGCLVPLCKVKASDSTVVVLILAIGWADSAAKNSYKGALKIHCLHYTEQPVKANVAERLFCIKGYDYVVFCGVDLGIL